jgi:hypothetical protein
VERVSALGGKGGRKGPPIVWEESLGPDSFPELVYEFPVESKSEFTKDAPLTGNDNRNEDWPKCMHGENCLVQMCAEGVNGSRWFFRCPRAWVILPTIRLLNMFLFLSATNKTYFFQSSAAPENYRLIRWVDPAPMHPHQDYIYYLQSRIFDLEMAVSDGNKDEEEDEDSNGAGSQEAPCSDAYYNCPCHKKNGPPSPPPPPPPPIMEGYYGERSP